MELQVSPFCTVYLVPTHAVEVGRTTVGAAAVVLRCS
jgi:hypothetical protein